jgi:uncharacterized membrane protein YkvA (DUF1232 family)
MENDYSKNFSEPSLMDKIKKVAKKVGGTLIYYALLLFEISKKPEVPVATKLIIYGALGYFIFPVDVITDILPGGYTDDLGILSSTLLMVAQYNTPETDEKVKNDVRKLFNDESVI